MLVLECDECGRIATASDIRTALEITFAHLDDCTGAVGVDADASDGPAGTVDGP